MLAFIPNFYKLSFKEKIYIYKKILKYKDDPKWHSMTFEVIRHFNVSINECTRKKKQNYHNYVKTESFVSCRRTYVLNKILLENIYHIPTPVNIYLKQVKSK